MEFSDGHPSIPEAAKSPENRKTRTQGQKKEGKKDRTAITSSFYFCSNGTVFSDVLEKNCTLKQVFCTAHKYQRLH
jgi:hypothetical protein